MIPCCPKENFPSVFSDGLMVYAVQQLGQKQGQSQFLLGFHSFIKQSQTLKPNYHSGQQIFAEL